MNDLYETTEGFELITSGAEHAYLYVRAAQEIGACLPAKRIRTEELEALIAHCETELHERNHEDIVKPLMNLFDGLIADLTGEVF